jgi:hypothetical protein
MSASALRPVVVYGALGLVSGFLTPHLSDVLRDVVPDWGIVEVPLSLWLAGLAFAAALTAASAWLLGFQPRQLLFVPFVLLGWFAAVQICVSMRADEPKSYTQALADTDKSDICIQLDGAERSDAASAPQQQCYKLFPTRADGESSENRFWQSFGGYVLAGGVGALITAIGIPFAVGSRFSRPTLLAVTLAGAAVAAAWFLLAGNIAAFQADQHWYALFVPWQAAVAALVGRASSA